MVFIFDITHEVYVRGKVKQLEENVEYYGSTEFNDYNAISRYGLEAPMALISSQREVTTNKQYDQILHHPAQTGSVFTDRGGVLYFYEQNHRVINPYEDISKEDFTYQLSDSLAGRMEIIHLRSLAPCEIAGIKPQLIEQFFDFDSDFDSDFESELNQNNYERLGESLSEIICAGGYSSAIARSSAKRRTAWYRDYIITIIQRDIQDIAKIRNLDHLPKLLTLAASQTARLFNAADLATPFSISRPTIREDLTLLEQVFLIEQLQPWHSNRLS